MKFKTIIIWLSISNFITSPFFAQQLDPIHYPPQAEWVNFKTKNTDSLIQVMKYYFLSDDTLFFREATSQSVFKISKKDLKTPEFDLGQDYSFAYRFYGPEGAKARRTSKNEKLDRFYYYYLNSPELKFAKQATTQDQMVNFTTGTPITASFYSAIQPHILLKSGQVLRPEKVYFLSEGQLYFGHGVKKNIYKIDTSAIASVVGYQIGENLRLMHRRAYVLGGRCLRLVAIILGYPTTYYLVDETNYDLGSPIAGALIGIPYATFFIMGYVEGTKRIQNYKRFKRAKYVQLQ